MLTSTPWNLVILLLRWSLVLGSTHDVVQQQQAVLFPAAPVVGILAQPARRRTANDSTEFFDNDQQYIAASYVKWIEAGGARSIPIPYDATDSLLDDLFKQMHALFLPGGASTMPYAVTYLLNKAAESNQNGHYFPVWGTCLGFEFLIRHFCQDDTVLQAGFRAHNMSLALEQVRPVGLYRDPTVFFTVTQENVTLNNHQIGIEPRHFAHDPQLALLWHMTSVNRDAAGRPFVSSMEPIDPDHFPFYGVQFHPEKNAFEYATWPHTNIPYENINHSPAAVAFSEYMARFVVSLSQRTVATNSQYHAYTEPDRFPLTITYPQQVGVEFEQIYLVPPAREFIKSHSSIRLGDTKDNYENQQAAA